MQPTRGTKSVFCRRCFWWFALFCVSALMLGCSNGREPTYPVLGKVVFRDGTAVTHGTVEFRSKRLNRVALGKINREGEFRLTTFDHEDGAIAGEHQVVVVQVVILDGATTHAHDHGPPVDLKYADYNSSDLTATVKPDAENRFELVVDAQ